MDKPELVRFWSYIMDAYYFAIHEC